MTEADKSGLTGFVLRVSRWISGLDRVAMTVLRIGVLIVLLWIGGLKWFKYEADGIVPFVATSPLMRWMIKEAYSQATCQPVKPLVRARLRMAVNKPQGSREL